MSEEAKLNCQHCGGEIIFEAVRAFKLVHCPHCGKETEMYVPSQFFSEIEKEQDALVQKIRKTPPGQLTESEKALSALGEKAKPQINIEAIEKIIRESLKKGKSVSDDQIREVVDKIMDVKMFSDLCYERFRDLRAFRARIISAIDRNDHEFFVQLGKELKRKPSRYVNQLGSFIALGWDAGFMNIFPPLKYFTDEALVDFLKFNPQFSSVTFDQVRKARQRLGLHSKNIKIKGVETKENGKYFRYIWVDKGG